MRHSIFVLLGLILVGCFKDRPKLPQYYATQHIDVVQDEVICFSGQEDFTHFLLGCSAVHDSVHWYALSWGGDTLLGNGNPHPLPITYSQYSYIQCLGFSDLDTTVYDVSLNYCGRHIYIPTAFNWWTPWGYGWAPVVNTRDTPYSIYWEIRTLDGIKIFESTDVEQRWEGGYNGSVVPRGAYFYRIELTIEGEETVVYTGWLEFYG
ncbi:MAG: gliding motility-associated C-terminal domain-containing protein [Flavobacteriales bacterium]|nr:gliding motility-associated C-terminal domain-containing protein [Flavobacteriales bacterium]MCB9191792.1 gliding motility-associated C-terminal domain-containing protein [Flavobacteriales bacterium]